MEDDDSSVQDHKLCGFLYAVLRVSSSHQPHIHQTLPFATRFHIFREDLGVGFRSDDGVILLPIGSRPESVSSGQCGVVEDVKVFGYLENCGNSTPESRKRKGIVERRSWRKKKRSIGMVNGSMSVVEQLHALVSNKCLEIVARVVWVEADDSGETRAVLLVDVYLPVALWSGWQFPRSGATAGAFFRHLSCEWGQRSSTIGSGDYIKDTLGACRDMWNLSDCHVLGCCEWGQRSSTIGSGDYIKDTLGACRDMWNLSDCHVLGCPLHHNVTDFSKGRLFELHEIFKSLPGVEKKGNPDSSRIQPVDDSCSSGIWELSDDVLINVISLLGPTELVRIAATCRHLGSLAVLVMPCMKLKLFPHQHAAVQWMLHRERHAGVLEHPLYMNFSTKDGFPFFISTISGEIGTGTAPTINDFRGGMFCDEPGLGKTITAISLILKTLGTLADPPDGAQVNWCTHNGDHRCGYYELGGDHVSSGGNTSLGKRDMSQKAKNGVEEPGYYSSKRAKLVFLDEQVAGVNNLCSGKQTETSSASCSKQEMRVFRCIRNLSQIKKNLNFTFEGESGFCKERKGQKNSSRTKHVANGTLNVSWEKPLHRSHELSKNCKRLGNGTVDHFEINDTWVQCDACHKWRKLRESCVSDAGAAWFCSMNTDTLYQSCSIPEESWDNCWPIMNLPGFYTKGTSGGKEQNVSFFTSILKEHYPLINSATKKALSWLARLSLYKLSVMETVGLQSPFVSTYGVTAEDSLVFQTIFQSFGLRKRAEKNIIRWYYPQNLQNLAFDVDALRIALSVPLDSVRLYLSRATLVVVPLNLVDHWKSQIQKHVSPAQLRVYIWTDNKKPLPHILAWDYDVVITTFNRLSQEWGSRKKSVLKQVHWLRIMLDEGHTLGSSVNLTNKMQMAVSLVASSRWILTGTPTPNTPNSQLSHLQPLLKFLHEEAYGKNQKSWEAGILRPFEAEMEEGRLRLLHLLNRCMISARKADLQNIPPCIKKSTFIDFTEEHAKSYNELVVTVRRNILMADWNDPSHVESLLNRKQWKFRSNTIRNVRLSCCVAGHIKVTDAGEDIQETMDVLVENGLDPMSEEYAFIKYNLLYGGNCVRCEQWCRLPVITPCRHLLCLDCVALDSERCTYPGCENSYEMQTPDTLARPENPEPKWPVPKDLIELQPSYKQDNWDPDWQSTSSSKVAYLIHRLRELQEANIGICPTKDAGSVDKHMDGLLCPSPMSKSKILTEEFDDSQMSSRTGKVNIEKVLVFSQFLEHIHVIEQQLTIAGIKFAGMYSPMHHNNKVKSLSMFQNDPTCMVLLMDGSAALGLDLSFVTHVFLMEPIWDKSMEEQVISRAHRMGATRPIQVETLAMRGTIEEQMLMFLQDPEACRRFLKEEIQKNDGDGARTHRSLHDFAERNYLSHLRFVWTNRKL